MTARYVHELPAHFHNSDLYLTIQKEYPGQKVKLGHKRPLKLDNVFRTFEDVLLILDTCKYLGTVLPWEVLDFAYSNPAGFLFDMEVFEYQAQKNNHEYGFFMKTSEYHSIKQCFLFSKSQESTQFNGFVKYSIKQDSLLLIKYYEHKCKYLFPTEVSTLLYTVQLGRLEILQYFQKKTWFAEKTAEKSVQKKLCEWASVFGQLHILQFLREQLIFEWDTNVVNEAITYRRFNCLNYALENCAPIPSWALGMAIQTCPIEFIEVLIKYGCPIQDDIYSLYACQCGKLDILMYLHNKGAPWHSNAVNVAARKRFKECVDFGVECGAQYDAELVLKYIFPEEWKRQVAHTSTSDSDDECWILE
jgi:hypothetical protein